MHDKWVTAAEIKIFMKTTGVRTALYVIQKGPLGHEIKFASSQLGKEMIVVTLLWFSD